MNKPIYTNQRSRGWKQLAVMIMGVTAFVVLAFVLDISFSDDQGVTINPLNATMTDFSDDTSDDTPYDTTSEPALFVEDNEQPVMLPKTAPDERPTAQASLNAYAEASIENFSGEFSEESSDEFFDDSIDDSVENSTNQPENNDSDNYHAALDHAYDRVFERAFPAIATSSDHQPHLSAEEIKGVTADEPNKKTKRTSRRPSSKQPPQPRSTQQRSKQQSSKQRKPSANHRQQAPITAKNQKRSAPASQQQSKQQSKQQKALTQRASSEKSARVQSTATPATNQGLNTAARHSSGTTDSPPVNRNVSPESVNALVTAAELNTLLSQLTHAYNTGDLARLVSVFAENLHSNDESGIKNIEEDYRKLFNITDMRKMYISGVRWSEVHKQRHGEGKFQLLVREKGAVNVTQYAGNISIDVEKNGKNVLITRLNYHYSN